MLPKLARLRQIVYLAERGGFEPPVPVTQHNCLAGSPVQPLQHLSTPNKNLAKDLPERRVVL